MILEIKKAKQWFAEMAKSCTRRHAPRAHKNYSRLATAVVTRDRMSPEDMLVSGVVTIKKMLELFA